MPIFRPDSYAKQNEADIAPQGDEGWPGEGDSAAE